MITVTKPVIGGFGLERGQKLEMVVDESGIHIAIPTKTKEAPTHSVTSEHTPEIKHITHKVLEHPN